MSKKLRSEAARVASMIKANKAEYYIADIELDDNSSEVMDSIELICKTLGKLKSSYMIVSAGDKVLTVVCYVQPEHKLVPEDWMKSSVIGLENIEIKRSNDRVAYVSYEPTEGSTTAFKLKDMIRANGFKYLSQNGCMGEQSSSEEEYFDI